MYQPGEPIDWAKAYRGATPRRATRRKTPSNSPEGGEKGKKKKYFEHELPSSATLDEVSEAINRHSC